MLKIKLSLPFEYNVIAAVRSATGASLFVAVCRCGGPSKNGRDYGAHRVDPATGACFLGQYDLTRREALDRVFTRAADID